MGLSPSLNLVPASPGYQSNIHTVGRVAPSERRYLSQRTESRDLIDSKIRDEAPFLPAPKRLRISKKNVSVVSFTAHENELPLLLWAHTPRHATKPLEVPDCLHESPLQSNANEVEVERSALKYSNGTPFRSADVHSNPELMRSGALELVNQTPPHFSLSISTNKPSQSPLATGVFAAHATLEVPTYDGNGFPS
eukprot:IDg11249t1